MAVSLVGEQHHHHHHIFISTSDNLIVLVRKCRKQFSSFWLIAMVTCFPQSVVVVACNRLLCGRILMTISLSYAIQVHTRRYDQSIHAALYGDAMRYCIWVCKAMAPTIVMTRWSQQLVATGGGGCWRASARPRCSISCTLYFMCELLFIGWHCLLVRCDALLHVQLKSRVHECSL